MRNIILKSFDIKEDQMPDQNKNRTPDLKADESIFDLSSFFPYLVRVFYRDVSHAVAETYTKAHGLTIYEWRAMAVIGNNQPLSASEVVDHSSLDKVQISRAIKGLIKHGFLERKVDKADRRRVNLSLTDNGNSVYKELVPMVLNREKEILSGLSSDEINTLKTLMNKVRQNAESCLIEG